MADPILLVELTGYTDASTSEVYRYSTRSYVTAQADTPSHTWYEPRVMEAGSISITQTLVSSGSAGARANPRAEVGIGVIRLANIDGELDAIFGSGSVSFREREARVLSVADGAAYSTATLLLVARISQAELSIEEVVVGLKDRLYEFQSPHLTATYAGTNSLPAGLEGVDDIKGKIKPALYGKAFKIQPPCVNTSRLIYQISTRALQSVDGVYDGGAALTAGTAYTDQTDMETNAPTAGQYRAWLSGGYIRLGSSLVYGLTVDATGDSAANSTAAQLLSAVAQERMGDGSDINATDVTTLDGDNSAVLGVWVDDDRSTLDIMDLIARSVGAVYRFDRLGVLRMRRFEPAIGNTVGSLADWNVASVTQLQNGEDVPTSEVRLQYARYHTVQGPSQLVAVGGSLTEADRADLGQEYRVAIYSADPTPNPHARTQTITRTTCLTDGADADAEAQRLHGLTNVPRRTHQLTSVQLDAALLAVLDVGEEVGLRWSRYGFSSTTETPVVVIGETLYLREQRADLIVWGG